MTPPRNLPNVITFSRLVLALLLFVILSLVGHAQGAAVGAAGVAGWVVARERLLLTGATVIFWLAAFSDFLDGYVARRWSLQTDFGRIVDPFADKVIVCGTFVFLIPIEGSHVAPWVVVTVLARELLIDGLRGYAESKGVAFPAMWSGKLKMFAQSACLTWILAAVANWPQASWAATANQCMQYLVVGACVISGWHYVRHAYTELTAATAAPTPAAGEA